MMLALWPPKPKLLLIAIESVRSLAEFGVSSRSHSGSGVWRLIVGGTIPLRIAINEITTSMLLLAPSEWPRQLLVLLIATFRAAGPKTVLIAVFPPCRPVEC